MAGYSRADFEADVAVLETVRHIVRTKLLAGEIDGFRAKRTLDRIDREELRLKGKLTAIMLSAMDRKPKKSPPTDGEFTQQWRGVSNEEARKLSDAGKMVRWNGKSAEVVE